MKYLFNTIHAINKLDTWWKLYQTFSQAKENPWYPVPVMENKSVILKEVINEDIATDEF